MDHDIVSTIASLLRDAAIRKKLVSYQSLHSLFAKNVPIESRYCALEKAAHALADFSVADYGSLLALDNGLPGNDFFLRFKRLRPIDYETVMGPASMGRSIVKQRLIATAERRRVFDHASLSAERGGEHAYTSRRRSTPISSSSTTNFQPNEERLPTHG